MNMDNDFQNTDTNDCTDIDLGLISTEEVSENDRSDWYKQSEYRISNDNTSEEDDKTTKRKKRKKVLLITLSIIIVLVAATFVLIRHFSGLYIISRSSSSYNSSQNQYPDNYQDFFSEYYGESSTSTSSDIKMKATQYTGSFSLEFSSSASDQLSLQEIYNKCINSVVSVTATTDDETDTYYGTGIIASSDGLILTNTHIIDGCTKVTVGLYDGSEYDADLIGADSISDITILKIAASGLTPAEFADSSSLQVGDEVIAIGNPLSTNLAGTMTNGIISAINRDISYNGRSMTLLQTNAAINEGNSGGPLIDLYGRVIGITNMKVMSSYSNVEGIGFAIPSATIKNITSQLITTGEVTGRPSIGITGGAVPSTVADHYSIPQGIYVASVNDDSDAKEKGIEAGDIITAINDTTVTTMEEVNSIKNTLTVGDSLKITVWRNGQTLTFEVVLQETNS